MNIAFLIQDITTHGGTERTTCCLANEMARQNDNVTIVSVFHEEDQIAYPLDKGVKIIYLSAEHYGLELGAVGRLKLVFKQIKAVKHCEVLLGADHIISQKFLASILSFLAGLSHKTTACEHYKYGMYNTLIRCMRNIIYRRFQHLVVLTHNDQQAFLQRGVNNVHVIENMVSITPVSWRGEDTHTLMSVGRLEPQKGYDLLLLALAKIKDKMGDWTMHIYGDGPERATLEQLAVALQLKDRVTFHPFTSQIEDVYASHEVYVMSSRFEGFPMVLLEAAATGLPIISFNCKEGPEALLKNGGGLLVPAEDVNALADTILNTITNASLRKQLHTESCKVVARYQPTAIYQKWHKLLSNNQ